MDNEAPDTGHPRLAVEVERVSSPVMSMHGAATVHAEVEFVELSAANRSVIYGNLVAAQHTRLNRRGSVCSRLHILNMAHIHFSVPRPFGHGPIPLA